MSSRSSASAAALGLAVLVSATSAAQKPRVVVLNFEGEAAGPCRKDVADGLAADYEVLGQEDWNHVAVRLGVAPSASQAAVAHMAPELRARAVVTGDIAKKGKRLTLALVVRDGKTGKQIDRGTFPVGEFGLQEADRQKAVAFVTRSAGKGSAGEPTLPPEPRAGAEATVEAKPEEPDTPWTRPEGASLVDASVGLALMKRSFSYDASGLRNYTSSPAGGIVIGLEGYPLLVATKGWPTGFGLAFGYGQVFTLSNEARNADGIDVDVGSAALRHVELGLRYRHLFAGSGFWLKGILGYARYTFQFDWNTPPGPMLPDASHNALRIGVEAGIPIGTLPARALVALSFLMVVGESGDLQADGGSGFDAVIGGDWVFMGRLAVGPRFRYTRVGVGDAVIDPTGASPATSDATDSYLEIGANVGYAF